MYPIKQRREKLREDIKNISSNRDRLDHLKNYYSGKTAIIVATGPGFQNHIDLIKENLNENTILICIKQSLKVFDYDADFHIVNRDHYTPYDYHDIVPIVLMTNYPERLEYQYGDIHFYGPNIAGIGHKAVNNWDSIEENKDTLTFCDNNNGPGENMVINSGHIMMETTLPLCIHLGVKNIIINGWVGGHKHGIEVKNELKNWDNHKYLFDHEEKMFRVSEKMEEFFIKHYGIKICMVCDSKYKIPQITYEKYIDIISE